MVTRVTHSTIQRSTLANLQASLAAGAKLQAQMSSGTKISVPSDDPAGAHDLLRLRSDLRAASQHERNRADGDAWLATVDDSLRESLSIIRAARDLAVKAGNGSLSPDAREALASEVEARRDELLQQANATYSGRHVFAGTSKDPAFGVTPPYTFSGTAAATVTREIGPGTTVRVDADGAATFGTGTSSAFAVLDQLAASIRAGNPDMAADLDAVDGRISAMLEQVASVGARHGQVIAAKDVLMARTVTLKEQIGGIEDIDLAQIVLDVQAQEVAYRGALGAAAKVLQPSLLDFLR
ncbi:MAG: flagellar hook-associated protein FlgL [Cellulomonas iranensis]|uniref:flagellar hook-associated protein FlgL n=1 Tax=Cellulomonas iranensis TaxID=76862 RepID=UPI001B2D2F49|nr:flagellar hook-associated protein FlgL [Cellulomonas iranensis]MBO9567956.1 flagellar hook-associated protein FlgL [Cellulomonas iranensis]